MEELANELGKLEIKEETVEQPVRVKKVGVLSDKRMLKHFTTKGHPEAPERITAIMTNLKEKGITMDKAVDTV
jgi:heterodisulfide reductase subunit B